MSSKFDALRDWIPEAAIRYGSALSGRRVRFQGSFDSWDSASASVEGYAETEILDRVRRATRKVVSGGAYAERDGALLDRIDPPYPLIAAIQDVALRGAESPSLIDFGGGLGSTYRQTRPFLRGIRSISWTIVEQRSFVECGKADFETEELRFCYDITSAAAAANPDLVLFSGVLQYLRSPSEQLREAVALQPEYLVVDRTPFRRSGRSVVAMQIVPRRLGGSRYPAWLFRREELFEEILASYEVIHSYPAIEGTLSHGLHPVEFMAFILRRRT